MQYTPHDKYINFLIKHKLYNEQVLKYIDEFAIRFNYYDENQRDYPTSTFPVKDIDGRIIGIRIIIPIIDDNITTVLNIQEYIKASIYCSQIGNIAEDTNAQIELALQILYTKLYIAENQTEELQQLEEAINKDEREECKKALELAGTL